MSQIEILIPEQWPGSADASFTWLMRSPQGALQRSGASPLGKIPSADKTFLILPAARVQLHTVRPPTKNRKKFMQALAYSLEDRIMAEPESIHAAAGKQMENGDVPVAVIDHAWLNDILGRLQAAGIRPIGAEVDMLLTPPSSEGVWTLVWQAGHGYVRTGLFSGFALDGGTMQEPPPALGLSAQKPAGIRLISSETPPDIHAWSAILGVPVQVIDEASGIPCGGDNQLNLLQGKCALSGKRSDWRPLLRAPLMLAVAVLVLHVGLTVTDWALLKYEKSRLNAEMEHSFRNSFPEAKIIVDAPLQMRRNLEALRQKAGKTSPDDYLPLLARAAPHLGSQASIRRIEYQQGKLKIDLTLPEAESQALRSRLPDAQIESTPDDAGGAQTTLTLSNRKGS